MWYFTVLALFTVTSASLLSERGTSPVDEDKLRVFTYYFRKSLYGIIADKWSETEPVRERLDRERPVCEATFARQESACQKCAEKECDQNLVEVLLKKAEKVFKDLGKGVRDGLKDIGKPFEDIGKGLENLGGDVIEKVKDLGKNLENGIKDVGKGIEDGVKSVGSGVANGIKDIAKTVHKVFVPRIRLPRIRFRFRGFGKKKRSVDYLSESEELESYPSPDDAEYALFRRYLIESEVRRCMEKCAVCRPFLSDDETAQIRSVCGEEYVQLSTLDTIRIVLPRLGALHERVLNEEDLIVKSVDCDLNSYSMDKDEFSRAHINVYFEEGYQTYQSKHPFKVRDIPTSAALMAKEYYDLFMES